MQGQGNYFVIDYNDLINPDNFEWIRDNAAVGKLYLIENYPYNDDKVNLLLTCVENKRASIKFRNGNTEYTLQIVGGTIDFEVRDDLNSASMLNVIFHLTKGGNYYYYITEHDIPNKIVKAIKDNLLIYAYIYLEDNYLYEGQILGEKITTTSSYNLYLYDSKKFLYDGAKKVYNNATKLIILQITENSNRCFMSESRQIGFIDFGEVSLSGGSFVITDAKYEQLEFFLENNTLVQCQFTFDERNFILLPAIYKNVDNEIILFGSIEDGIYFKLIVKSDNTYTIKIHTDLLPVYKTLQVSGIESIAVNSSLTTSIQLLTDRYTTITSIKPSVAGVIVSAPYFDDTVGCYKTTIFNATTSAVSDLTLTVDYYTLTQD